MPRVLPHLRALKAKLVYEGYDQKALALALGKSTTYVTLRMNGTYSFTSKDIEAMVAFLNITTISDFFELFYPNLQIERGDFSCQNAKRAPNAGPTLTMANVATTAIRMKKLNAVP